MNNKIIYLYVKTHNITGLRYLGKCTSKNPHKYQGSGKYWIRHIKKYGYDVTTDILLETTNPELIKEWGIYYSDIWDIVNSKEWANLKIEDGDGGWGHVHNNPESIEKRRKWMIDNNPWRGKHHSEETKEKIRAKRSEQIMIPMTDEQKEKIGQSLKGHEVSEETKEKISLATKGKPKPNLKGVPLSEGHKKSLSAAQQKRFESSDGTMLGKKHSEETKQKIRNINLGKKHSEETKQKMRDTQSKRFENMISPALGRRISEDHKRKIGESQKGKGKSKLICPYCGKEGGSPAMIRWHFDNCKARGE